jgi:hypothetical protein
LIDLQNFKLQCAGNNQQHHSDCTPQLMPDPIQGIKEFENSNEMVSTSQVNSENIPQDGSEVITFFSFRFIAFFQRNVLSFVSILRSFMLSPFLNE